MWRRLLSSSAIERGRVLRTALHHSHRSALAADCAARIGAPVRLAGFLHALRRGGGQAAFAELRDESGRVQLRVDGALAARALRTPLESAIAVDARVAARPAAAQRARGSGAIEAHVSAWHVLSPARTPLPLPVGERARSGEPREEARLRARHLDLRHDALAARLRARSAAVHAARCALHAAAFTEIETPTLFRPTAEGAREFLVPTRSARRCYALPQSPQQYKQLLVCGGVPRYFQVARCYRDEAARADRQPEFTQLDIELAFADAADVQRTAECVALAMWHAARDELRRSAAASGAAEPEDGSGDGVAVPDAPFARMRHADALRCYGVDKPDVRYDMELSDVSELLLSDASMSAAVPLLGAAKSVQAVVARGLAGKRSRKQLDAVIACALDTTDNGSDLRIVALPCDASNDVRGGGALVRALREHKRLAPLLASLDARGDDVLVLAFAKSSARAQALGGAARIAFAADAVQAGVLQLRGDAFLWIVDFPLFELDSDGRLASAHHPFTAPQSSDVDALLRLAAQPPSDERLEQLLALRAQHYDLVLNGFEIGGGSVRIHSPDMQRRIFELLALNERQVGEFAHLLDALADGAPPHAGIAFGIDRLMAMLCGVQSIREVIAFPKTAGGNELLTGAPAPVSQEHLDQYNIKWIER